MICRSFSMLSGSTPLIGVATPVNAWRTRSSDVAV
jgi:hypothetical protein